LLSDGFLGKGLIKVASIAKGGSIFPTERARVGYLFSFYRLSFATFGGRI
jgi:hypothetical protein